MYLNGKHNLRRHVYLYSKIINFSLGTNLLGERVNPIIVHYGNVAYQNALSYNLRYFELGLVVDVVKLLFHLYRTL